MLTVPIGLLAFFGGAVLVVLATERLLEGLVGISQATRLAPFVVSAILSGLEAENVAVGVAAGHEGSGEIALGTAFGGATFLVCIALGIGAIVAPLRARMPRGVLVLLVGAVLVSGISLIGTTTPRWAGIVLLVIFVAAMAYIVRVSRDHRFLEASEIRESGERKRSLPQSVAYTVAGIAVLSLGGELVARGATSIVAALGVPALLMGMVVTPAVIELEEIARQVIPTRRGHADVAAGNVVGTVLYFLLFNLGLIILITPVAVPPLARWLDWPFLIGCTLIASAMLWRGTVTRRSGAMLLGLGVLYAGLHVVIR
jgi:cation:H+ antiporter